MMEQRELEQRIKALNSAVQNQEPASNIISILQSLQKDVVPTEELLRATKAGIIVARQRANPNKEVAKLAAEIVAKWKKMVEAAKNKKKLQQSASSPTTTTGTASPAPAASAAAPAAAKGYTGDPAKRKWETDGVTVKRTGVASRDACIGLMYNGLAFMSEESTTAVILKAVEVERAAFEALGGDTAEYRNKLRSLFQNLKNKQNRELGPRVMSGEISAHKFVTMTHDELKSTNQRLEEKKLQEENIKNAQTPQAERSISDALKCGKCGQKKVSYTQAQTRSADEPMTTFCVCTVCGNRWKFS